MSKSFEAERVAPERAELEAKARANGFADAVAVGLAVRSLEAFGAGRIEKALYWMRKAREAEARAEKKKRRRGERPAELPDEIEVP